MDTPHMYPLPLRHTTREGWLADAAEWLAPIAMEAAMTATGDHIEDMPPVQYACGWPVGSRGQSDGSGKSTTIGQCLYGTASKNGTSHVYISPLIDNAARVLDILLHEMLHALLPEHGHDRTFAKAALAAGLAGKPTATVAGEAFNARIPDALRYLGAYPHAAVSLAGRKKQSTRLIKIMCPDVCTDMPIRITRKWLDAGLAPLCPCCGEAMQES